MYKSEKSLFDSHSGPKGPNRSGPEKFWSRPSPKKIQIPVD